MTSCRAWTIARCDKIVSRLADRLRAEAEGKASGMSARSGASSQRLSGRADNDKESVRPAASWHATHGGLRDGLFAVRPAGAEEQPVQSHE